MANLRKANNYVVAVDGKKFPISFLKRLRTNPRYVIEDLLLSIVCNTRFMTKYRREGRGNQSSQCFGLGLGDVQ